MKTSPNGIKFIAEHEGEILRVYKDPIGLPTLGVGHLLSKAELAEMPVGTKITKEQSRAYLAKDLARFERAINANVQVKMTQNQFDALVSFSFNIGESAFQRSSCRRKLNEKNYAGAADAMLAWNKAGGRILPGLVRRRKEERALFLKPDSTPVPQSIPPTAQNDASVQQASDDFTERPGHTIKAEITSEGGVTVEKTEGPSVPKERIAVVQTKPEKWYTNVTAKITGLVSGNVLFQWLWAQIEKIQGLSVPDAVWIIVSLTIAIGSLLWIIFEIFDTWRKNNYRQSIDELLVKENSTPDNLVQLIPADEVDLYRVRGYKIITRGDKGVPLRAATEAEKA